MVNRYRASSTRRKKSSNIFLLAIIGLGVSSSPITPSSSGSSNSSIASSLSFLPFSFPSLPPFFSQRQPQLTTYPSSMSPLTSLSNQLDTTGSWPFGSLPSLSWFTEGSLTIVDRQPPIYYTARQAMFGPKFEDPLMGYLIPLSEFTVTCPTTEESPPLHSASSSLTDNKERGRGWFSSWNLQRQASLNSTPSDLACTNLCLPTPSSPRPESSDTWIALVHRGECEFAAKVREAQRWGAKAVIVGGYDDDMINMYSQGRTNDITIPSAYIPLSSLLSLTSLLLQSNTTLSHLPTLSVLLSFSSGSAFPWYSPLLTFAFLLLLPSLLTLVTLGVHRVRVRNARRRERASKDFVGGLPWRVWGGEGWEKWPNEYDCIGEHQNRDHDHASLCSNPATTTPHLPSPFSIDESSSPSGPPPTLPLGSPLSSPPSNGSPLPPWYRLQSTCPICLSPYATGDRIRILPCNHIFHLEEVDEWLVRRRKLCPVCKADVTHPPDPLDASDPSHPAFQDSTDTEGTLNESSTELGASRTGSMDSSEELEPVRETERTPLLTMPLRIGLGMPRIGIGFFKRDYGSRGNDGNGGSGPSERSGGGAMS